MIQQAEILKHHADAPPQPGDRVLVKGGRIAAEQCDEATRRLEREKDQAQQSRLTGARGPGEELEGLRCDIEAEILKDFSSHSIAQTDVFESDQGKPRRLLESC